jgi:hypothetical protein
LLSVPDQISGQVAQLLPFQYRPLLDSGAQQELFGLGSLRYPRWALTLIVYTALTILLVALSSVAIDPCHRLKANRWARVLLDRGTNP